MSSFGDFTICPTCGGEGTLFGGLPPEGEPGTAPIRRKGNLVRYTCTTCFGGNAIKVGNKRKTRILIADTSIEPDAEGIPGMPTVD